MEYKKLEKLVYNNNLIKRENCRNKKEYDIKLELMLINNLKKCIEKKIMLNMDENDLLKVYKIYLNLNKNNYSIDINFIKDLVNISEKKLNFFEIVSNIE